MSDLSSSRLRAAASRWLGVGLAAVLAVVTLGAALTGALAHYVSAPMVWFAAAMSAIALAGALWSCTLPLGSENEPGNDPRRGSRQVPDAAPRRSRAAVGVVIAGVIATLVVVGALLLPTVASDGAVGEAGVSDEF